MKISADQCRAGRGLLNWTQEQLAANAFVSRATIADFESNSRQPLTNNLRSIADSMFAAGVEFIPEKDASGDGVRFRRRKLRFYRGWVIDRPNREANISMSYAGEDFLCHISFDAVADYHRRDFKNDDEYSVAVNDMLHIILATVEKVCALNPPNGELEVTYEMLV